MLKASLSSLSLLIDFLGLHILSLFHIHTLQSQQLKFSLSTYLNCMGCLKAQYVTEMLHLLVSFGRSFLTCRELALILVHSTIPRPTGKQRWSIELLKCIYAVSQATGQRSGYNGFHGLSIAITPASTPLLGGLLMRLFTVSHLTHFYLMFLALHK